MVTPLLPFVSAAALCRTVYSRLTVVRYSALCRLRAQQFTPRELKVLSRSSKSHILEGRERFAAHVGSHVMMVGSPASGRVMHLLPLARARARADSPFVERGWVVSLPSRLLIRILIDRHNRTVRWPGAERVKKRYRSIPVKARDATIGLSFLAELAALVQSLSLSLRIGRRKTASELLQPI